MNESNVKTDRDRTRAASRSSGIACLACAFAIVIGASACGQGATTARTAADAGTDNVSAQAHADDNNRSTGGSVTVTGTKVSITLPKEQSSFPKIAETAVADTTPCATCHNGVIAEVGAINEKSPRFELVKEECTDCHSADYSLYQPRLDSIGWARVVKKMADKFDTTLVNGQPVVDVMLNPEHQALMVEYLVTINGK